MKKKAAIEVSVNFLVVIIISIVVISMGFVFMNRAVGGGNDNIKQMEDQLAERIERLLEDNSAPVAIPIVQREITRGDEGQFGVGVLNLKNDGGTTFSVYVDDNIFIKEGTNDDVNGFNAVKLMGGFDLANDNVDKEIAFQKNEKFVIPIKVDEEAESGMYVFNVCVCQSIHDNCVASLCTTDTASNLYSKQMYKIYVKVP